MDHYDEMESFLLPIVVLLENIASVFANPVLPPSDDAVGRNSHSEVENSFINMDNIVSSVLYDFRLRHSGVLLGDDLSYWVKPRSTTWFSRFLLQEYDDGRWVENFRMSKDGVRSLASILSPHLYKQDTNYRRAIPVLVRVALALYKITQGATLLQVSEAFAVGKSMASYIIREFIVAVNVQLRNQIAWPTGRRVTENMSDFKELCGLPGVIGAIDGTHIGIRKPSRAPEDYYYHKSGGYSIQAQAVVNREKKFLDVAVGMSGSTNDVRVLRRSALYTLATTQNLFDHVHADEGFTPYLLGDKGYPLLPWLLTPYRDFHHTGGTNAQERMFNYRLRTGRCVVENAFGILKGVFRELRQVTETHVNIVPDLVICCCLLHNLLLGQRPEEVARLLAIIDGEGAMPERGDDLEHEIPLQVPGNLDFQTGNDKRAALSRYLIQRRNLA